MPLRGTQQAAFDATLDAFKDNESRVLLVQPCGWGKTYFAAELFRYCIEKWDINCLFVVHTKELVKQTHEAMEGSKVMCAGLGKKEIGKITIGTRQTISKNLDVLPKINLLLIDEQHYMSDGDQYHDIINHCQHDKLRILGLTATPFRTSEGFVYGDGKFFKEVTHQTTLDQMIELGFLSPYRYKVVEKMKELDNFELGKGGDYNEKDLSELMVEERHMKSIVHALENHCKGRNKIMVFCVSVDHAESLAKKIGCSALHSKMHDAEWAMKMDAFKYGEERIITNVVQLTVGVNIPNVDCIIQARPTMSPALFTQICGRALRIAEGKKDALILDMVGNYGRHGLPSNPKVRKPKEKQEEREKKELESNVCHECFEIVEGGILICPCCGADLVDKKEFIEIDKRMKLKEIETQRKKPKFIKHWHKTHRTKKGNHGVMFCIKVTGRDKPLFKFCGANTKKIQKTIEKVDSLVAGQVVDIVSTATGDWIA